MHDATPINESANSLINLAGNMNRLVQRLHKARHFVFWIIVAAIPFPSPAEPTPAAVAGFNSYIASVESRLGQQHRSPGIFVASIAQNEARLRQAS